MTDLNIEARQSYIRFSDDRNPIYYINHTDHITLIDAAGRIRKHYSGSQASTEEIVTDIDQLLTQPIN